MSGQGKHTPTPWRISSTPESPRLRPRRISRYFSISPESGPAMITLDEGRRDIQEANAEFIVKAVNAHNALVDALKRARPFIELVQRLLPNGDAPRAKQSAKNCETEMDAALMAVGAVE